MNEFSAAIKMCVRFYVTEKIQEINWAEKVEHKSARDLMLKGFYIYFLIS